METPSDLFCWQHGASPEAPASQRASGGCIGEPLAFETLHGERGTLRVGDAKFRSRVAAERRFLSGGGVSYV